jgi:polyisoprenyl-teichoic acid--peptidoglycan teichoic acid transferase
MHFTKITLPLIILSLLLASCSAPGALNLQMAFAQSSDDATATPELFLAPPNATPTPTPFQPLPPTPAFHATETPIPTATPLPLTPTPTLSLSDTEVTQEPELVQPVHQVNILLMGADARPKQKKFRTDALILVTMNMDLGTVHLTSFPRDLWVTLPGWGPQRINTAYEFGGFNLVDKTFDYNFGVHIDHHVLINFSSFKRVVDSLGGLDVNVETVVSDYRDGRWYTVPKGVRHMDADDVLWFCRTRKTTNDFYRTQRQQDVLQALVDKLLKLDVIKRAPDFWNIYQENVTTDLSLTDLIPWLPLATKITDSSKIDQFFIGPKQVSSWVTPEGAMVLLPQKSLVQQVIRKALNIQ